MEDSAYLVGERKEQMQTIQRDVVMWICLFFYSTCLSANPPAPSSFFLLSPPSPLLEHGFYVLNAHAGGDMIDDHQGRAEARVLEGLKNFPGYLLGHVKA